MKTQLIAKVYFFPINIENDPRVKILKNIIYPSAFEAFIKHQLPENHYNRGIIFRFLEKESILPGENAIAKIYFLAEDLTYKYSTIGLKFIIGDPFIDWAEVEIIDIIP